MPVRVAIVEDDAGLRESLVIILSTSEDFRCVGVFASGEEALTGIPPLRPEVVLMDIKLPGISGIECVARLKRRLPELSVVMLTVFEDSDKLFSALKAGADGYLVKSTPAEELLVALREVLRGGAPLSSHIARKVVQSFHQVAAVPETQRLTDREQDILGRLAQGYLIKEIADQLGVSLETVRTHMKHIYEKLHVNSRTQAVLKYLGR